MRPARARGPDSLRVLVLATPRSRERGGCEGARRAAHELGGGVAAEARDVGEPDEGLDAAGGADGEREAVDLLCGEAVACRREGIFEPGDRAALSQWEVLGVVAGFEGESQLGAKLVFVGEQLVCEVFEGDVETGQWVARGVAVEQAWRVELRICGDDELALVGEVAVGGGA